MDCASAVQGTDGNAAGGEATRGQASEGQATQAQTIGQTAG